MLGAKEQQTAEEKSSSWVWVLFIIFAAGVLLLAWYSSQIFLLEEDSVEQDSQFLIPPKALKK
ncbi:MAG: hypothetical protein O2794_00340 [bacterium]|nr:hypothetical protein [bacterium]